MSDDKPRPGPTGRFPDGGPIHESDQGGLACAVGVRDGQIVLEFGTPVSWVSLGPQAARLLAAVLVARANKIDGGPAAP